MNLDENKKKVILIIDDEILMAQTTANRIVAFAENFEVFVESNPLNALDLISKKSPNLILLDYMMPEITGLECLVKIRKIFSKLELPIIMMTSEEASENLVKAFDEGVNDYIVKGSPLPVIMSRINSQLNIIELARDRIKLHELQAVMALVVSYNHEINNPLAAAIASLSTYKTLADNRKYEIMEKSLCRIADVVKDLKEIGEKHKLDFDKNDSRSNLNKINK